MEQVIYSLLESQVQKIMLANVRDDYVFSVIDPATEPKKPFKPRKQLIISLGLIIGLMLSSSFIITRKMISR
jgi:LPS O-antigen subunit length determinant protein (WzzB/FepE family)